MLLKRDNENRLVPIRFAIFSRISEIKVNNVKVQLHLKL
jgi:hypothetical protein